MDTPQSYAKHLATYIASPTKIEALTRLEFDRAPPLHTIAAMRLAVEDEARRFKAVGRHACKDKADRDGEDFAPRGLKVPLPPKVKPISFTPLFTSPHPAAVREIIAKVAEAFGFTPDVLTSDRKFIAAVHARAVAIRLIRDRTWENGEHKHSTTTIGRYFGRDHSTVCHALSHFPDYCRHHPEVGEIYEALRETPVG